MKRSLMLTAIMAFALTAMPILAQDIADDDQPITDHGIGFVDLDGDGYNDNAPDADGDGIPNGMDEDYVNYLGESGQGFVDLDGDGINDNAGRGQNSANRGQRGQGGYGPGDGTGNQSNGPADGTGYGPGDCTGTQDGAMNQQKTNNRKRNGKK